MQNKTDEELFKLVQDGNENAFAIILNRYLSKSLILARKINSETYEDTVQDTFIKIWQNAYKWDIKKGKLSSWVYKILKNTAISSLKNENKFLKSQIDENNFKIDFFDKIENQELKDEFKNKLENNLTKKEHLTVIYKYYEDLSNISIAKKLSLSIKAVESILARSKKKLKKHFKEV